MVLVILPGKNDLGRGQNKPTRGPQVLVFGSIYQGNPFLVRILDPHPNEGRSSSEVLPKPSLEGSLSHFNQGAGGPQHGGLPKGVREMFVFGGKGTIGPMCRARPRNGVCTSILVYLNYCKCIHSL